MGPKQKLITAIVIALMVLFLSMFLSYIPCQTAPNIPNPQFKWTSCTLNPDTQITGIQRLYFGYTPAIREAYAITFTITFIICFLILLVVFKKKRN